MFLWALLCWCLGELVQKNPASIGALGWAFFAVQGAGVVLSFLYSGAPAMVLTLLVALFVGSAAWLPCS